jgi:hypothetical protein
MSKQRYRVSLQLDAWAFDTLSREAGRRGISNAAMLQELVRHDLGRKLSKMYFIEKHNAKEGTSR